MVYIEIERKHTQGFCIKPDYWRGQAPPSEILGGPVAPLASPGSYSTVSVKIRIYSKLIRPRSFIMYQTFFVKVWFKLLKYDLYKRIIVVTKFSNQSYNHNLYRWPLQHAIASYSTVLCAQTRLPGPRGHRDAFSSSSERRKRRTF